MQPAAQTLRLDAEAGKQPAVRVSVVIPCLNEERYIGRTVESILAGSFDPDQMEVLVVDGRSTDKSRAVVEEIARRDPRVHLLDNPLALTPSALNIGIRAARGEIIIRVDSHSEYPPNYVEVLVRTLESTGADMVGAWVENVFSEKDSLTYQAMAIATGSSFGTGARFRYRRESGPVDAVVFGCWRRELFDRVGMFDERLVRNQDNEHSSRIRRAGGRLYQTVDATIRYHSRSSLPKLWAKSAATGMWNAFTERLHPYTFRWRHFLPGVFFVGAITALSLIAVGLVIDRRLVLFGAACVAPYAMANLLFSCATALRLRRWALAPVLAFVTFSNHFVYGYGITKGWLLVATGGWRRRLGKITRSRVL